MSSNFLTDRNIRKMVAELNYLWQSRLNKWNYLHTWPLFRWLSLLVKPTFIQSLNIRSVLRIFDVDQRWSLFLCESNSADGALQLNWRFKKCFSIRHAFTSLPKLALHTLTQKRWKTVLVCWYVCYETQWLLWTWTFIIIINDPFEPQPIHYSSTN